MRSVTAGDGFGSTGNLTLMNEQKPTRPVDGDVALITGAARGQGRSHALALAERGVSLALCDVNAPIAPIAYPLASEEDLEETREMVSAFGVGVHVGTVDVRDLEALQRFVGEAESELGPVDIAITNAGVTAYGSVADSSAEDWSTILDVNLTGTFNTMRAVAAGMRERRRGRIVTVASMMGRSSSAGIPAYSASKWGVIGLTKSAALELAPFDVTVNSVAPGNIRTPMIDNEMLRSLMRPDLESPTLEDLAEPLGTLHTMDVPWLEPEEVTAAVLYLLSPGARHVTGTVMDVDAGAGARNTA